MSFEEKNTWIGAVVAIGAYAVYLATILGRAEGVPLSEVAYVAPMLWAIGAAIAASIVGRIAVAIAKPSEADKTDVRDKDIYRFGEYVGGIVLGVGMLVPFGLALAEFAHFWIANAIYAVFVLSALCGATVKLVAYRRGF
jgi:drug/metabolite transporter (DMT)-like permease